MIFYHFIKYGRNAIGGSISSGNGRNPAFFKVNLKRFLLLIVCSLNFLPLAYASSLDAYELKGRMENIQTVYMPEPQIILGRRDEKHALFTGDEPGRNVATRAIYHAAADAFAEQGYALSLPSDETKNLTPEQQQQMENAWKHLDQFADAGMEKKPKLWPFSLSPDHTFLVGVSNADAIAFVQCYGKFDSQASPDAEVAGKAVLTAAQVALTGSAFIFRGDYATLEFKLSVIDVKTGELIFFRESLEVDTDVRDKARLMGTFTKAFKWYLPKASHPAPKGTKFKRKRSQLTVNKEETDALTTES